MKTFNPKAFKDRLRGHKEAVISLFSPFGPQGHMLYSVSREGAARGWDLAKRQITIKCTISRKYKQQELQDEPVTKQTQNDPSKNKQAKESKPRQQILSACFSQKFIFASYEDGQVTQFNFTNESDIANHFIGHTKRVTSLFLMNKNILVTGSYDSTIRTWNIQTGEAEAVYKTAGQVNLVVPGQNNEIYAVVGRNTFYQINIKTNAIVRCIKFSKHSISNFICKDELLVFGNIENKLLVYDLKTFDPENPTKFQPKKLIQGLGGWVLEMKLHNNYLYTGCDDKKIRVYSWPQVNEVQELPGHDDGIISIEFASKMLFSGSYDHSIRSWDIEEMVQRISERNCMLYEDVESKKYEVYYNVVFKNKKKKLPAKKKEKKDVKETKPNPPPA